MRKAVPCAGCAVIPPPPPPPTPRSATHPAKAPPACLHVRLPPSRPPPHAPPGLRGRLPGHRRPPPRLGPRHQGRGRACVAHCCQPHPGNCARRASAAPPEPREPAAGCQASERPAHPAAEATASPLDPAPRLPFPQARGSANRRLRRGPEAGRQGAGAGGAVALAPPALRRGPAPAHALLNSALGGGGGGGGGGGAGGARLLRAARCPARCGAPSCVHLRARQRA